MTISCLIGCGGHSLGQNPSIVSNMQYVYVSEEIMRTERIVYVRDILLFED